MKLTIGDKAPEFSLPDQEGTQHTLSQYKGKWVLLYFYPKDFTPGCTTEACSFRDNFNDLKDNVVILGVSRDTVDSHKKFAQVHALPFTILADPEKTVINAYGTDGVIFTKRTSFLINPEGIIHKIYEDVHPDKHVQEILADLPSRP